MTTKNIPEDIKKLNTLLIAVDIVNPTLETLSAQLQQVQINYNQAVLFYLDALETIAMANIKLNDATLDFEVAYSKTSLTDTVRSKPNAEARRAACDELTADQKGVQVVADNEKHMATAYLKASECVMNDLLETIAILKKRMDSFTNEMRTFGRS